MIDHAGQMLFLMIAGHAFADFGLQDAYQSQAKRADFNPSGWFHALLCHSLIHGGIVALVTGQWMIGVAETVAHAMIDYGKGRKWYGTTADQTMHIGYKIIWMIIAIS